MTDEEYKKKETELFDKENIPQEFRAELSYFAYAEWHGYGYAEIYNHLCDLVWSLSKSIQELIKRVKSE